MKFPLLMIDSSTPFLVMGMADSPEKIDLHIVPIPRDRDNWMATEYHRLLEEKKIHMPATIAIGSGPGSYTALRISFAFVRTMALLADLPLRMFGSMVLLRNILSIPADTLFIMQMNRNLFYGDFDHNGIKVFLAKHPVEWENEIKNDQYGLSGRKIYLWREAWRAVDLTSAPPLSNMPNFHEVRLDIGFTGSLFDFEKCLIMSSETTWHNVLPDYGHELLFTKK